MREFLGAGAFLVAAAFLLLSGTWAWAGLTVEAPDSVGDGKAFFVTAHSDEALTHISFRWRGRDLTVPAVPCVDGRGGWEAAVLLPVPLDTKPGVERLRVSAADGKSLDRHITMFAAEYPVQRLKVEGKYVTPSAEALARHEAERARVRAVLNTVTPQRYWKLPLYRPVPGDVSSEFGLRREFNGEKRAPHRGLDLRGAEGASIRACAAGRVALAENHYFSGNAVYVDHGFGVVSVYMHLSAFSVLPGDFVAAGDEIGKVGMTGRVTGPHLHFGIAVLGENIDPAPLLGVVYQ